MPRTPAIAVSTELRHEQGPEIPAEFERVAVVAHFADEPIVTRSFEVLVREFANAGYRVIVSSAAEAGGELIWPNGLPLGVTVYRRANVGYDFGSWAAVLGRFPQVRKAPYVVLANDSLVGPFASMELLTRSFESATAPVWGAVRSDQFRPHLQSFLVGYRDGVLDREPLARFWRGIRQERSKREVIERYELGFAKVLERARIRQQAAYSGAVISSGENPTIVGWQRLLEAGFPFVKRELLTNPAVMPDAVWVPDAVRARFGEDVGEWL